MHGYTSHGHACCDEAIGESRPNPVARCGGPGICPVCATEKNRLFHLPTEPEAVSVEDVRLTAAEEVRLREAGEGLGRAFARLAEEAGKILTEGVERGMASAQSPRPSLTRCDSKAMLPSGMQKRYIREDGHTDREPHVWLESYTVRGRRPIIATWYEPNELTISSVLIEELS